MVNFKKRMNRKTSLMCPLINICTGRCFLVALCHLIVRRPNLEVGTKRLLPQQVKIPG